MKQFERTDQVKSPRYCKVYGFGHIVVVDVDAAEEAIKSAMRLNKQMREKDTERTKWIESFSVTK